MKLTIRKTCIACHRLLPLREFHRDCRLKDGHKSTCRHCLNSVSMPTRQQQEELAEATKAALEVHTFACIAHCFRGFQDVAKDKKRIKVWKNKRKYFATADEMAIRTNDMWALAGMVGCWFGR